MVTVSRIWTISKEEVTFSQVRAGQRDGGKGQRKQGSKRGFQRVNIVLFELLVKDQVIWDTAEYVYECGCGLC